MKIRNTREHTDPELFRLVAMVYGLTGTGKTTLIGTLPPEDTGIAACETGEGNGLLSIAESGFDYCTPSNLSELQEFCSGKVFPTKKFLVIDSLSAMTRTLIKDAALAIPRAQGESAKRKAGVPELDDYGVIGEMTRKIIELFIQANKGKHLIVTALEKYDKPGPNDAPGTEALIGPDLAGQMFLGSPAMFDFVFRIRTRSALRNPNDAKSRYSERYLQTQQESGVIAKCRANSKKKALLDKEEFINLETGQGTFPYLIKKITEGYVKS